MIRLPARKLSSRPSAWFVVALIAVGLSGCDSQSRSDRTVQNSEPGTDASSPNRDAAGEASGNGDSGSPGVSDGRAATHSADAADALLDAAGSDRSDTPFASEAGLTTRDAGSLDSDRDASLDHTLRDAKAGDDASPANQTPPDAGTLHDVDAQHVLGDAGPLTVPGTKFCDVALWPNGIVPYTLTGGWSNSARLALLAAMDDWSQATAGRIQFVADSSAFNRVDFKYSENSECRSARGIQEGVQTLEVAAEICGEARLRRMLGRVAGLAYAEERSDRNRYLKFAPRFEAAGIIADVFDRCETSFTADLGPFTRASVMRLATSEVCSDASASECNIASKGASWQGPVSAVTPADASALLELYSSNHNWSAFQPVPSADAGPEAPLDMALAPGVQLVGAPALSSQGFGLLDTFALGSDGHVYHKGYYNGGWQAGYWEDLGGDFTTSSGSALASVSWSSGRIDVVALGIDGEIHHKTYSDERWRDWIALGKPNLDAPSAPAISTWGIDHLDVMVRSGNSLYQKVWNGMAYSGWMERRCCIDGTPAATSLSVRRNDVVVLDAHGEVWHQLVLNGGWYALNSIGGFARYGTSAAVASAHSDHLGVFITSQSGRVTSSVWEDSTWSTWVDLGGIPVAHASVVAWTGGQIHMVANIQGSGLWYREYTP